jgi:hypothetical protein
MTIAAMHSNASGHRHRAIRQRAPESSPSDVDSEPSQVSSEYTKATTNVPAIAAVVSVISVLVILGMFFRGLLP